MAVLVFGSTGQLAQHLRQRLPDATFLSRKQAELSDRAALEQCLQHTTPSVIVNAAAYTAVDQAESDPATAWRVNAEAPAAMAQFAAQRDIPLIQISTDYVFDGQSPRPYVETDPVSPLNVYGATKLAGELAVRSIAPKHWILRTSWVFSGYGTNFVKSMVRLARERSELSVVADQRGRPTYAGDLARLVVTLTEAQGAAVPYGTYHAVGGPACSWHEFARVSLEKAKQRNLIGKMPAIHAIASADYPTRARRPHNSVLEPSTALVNVHASFDWQIGLDCALRQMSE